MSVDLLTLQLCRLSHRWVQPILPVRIIDTVGTEDREALRNQRSTPYGCGDRGHDLDVSLVAEQLLHGVADKCYADNAGPADLIERSSQIARSIPVHVRRLTMLADLGTKSPRCPGKATGALGLDDQSEGGHLSANWSPAPSTLFSDSGAFRSTPGDPQGVGVHAFNGKAN